jgi:signal transduction histidine kinase
LNVNGRSLKQLQSTYEFKQKYNELELLKKINKANISVIYYQRYIATAFAVVILLMSVWAFNAYKTGKQRKKLNKKLVATNTELERLNRVKDKLFSVLSHDLRAPIATLKSLVGFLQEGDLKPEDLKPLYAGLGHQLEVSGNILESLLQWAKAELNQTKTNHEKVVLANVVNNVALQLKNSMDAKNIRFLNDLNFGLTTGVDKAQLEIILRNLISNSIKFTPAGGAIKIAGKVIDETIEVYVEDNGTGMLDEEVENLFEPGEHFTKAGTNQEKGTGLGLLITKEMIAKYGGSLWVNSRKNEGTVFVFTLPLAS